MQLKLGRPSVQLYTYRRRRRRIRSDPATKPLDLVAVEGSAATPSSSACQRRECAHQLASERIGTSFASAHALAFCPDTRYAVTRSRQRSICRRSSLHLVSLMAEMRGSQLHNSDERWVPGTFTHHQPGAVTINRSTAVGTLLNLHVPRGSATASDNWISQLDFGWRPFAFRHRLQDGRRLYSESSRREAFARPGEVEEAALRHDSIAFGVGIPPNDCWSLARTGAPDVRREKAASFQRVQAPPGNRSSRKQPEQAWR